jgi:hypothetical protein
MRRWAIVPPAVVPLLSATVKAVLLVHFTATVLLAAGDTPLPGV